MIFQAERKTFPAKIVNMADKVDEEYLQSHLQNYRTENGYVFGFFEGDLEEFLQEYMSSNSSCFATVRSEAKQTMKAMYNSKR